MVQLCAAVAALFLVWQRGDPNQPGPQLAFRPISTVIPGVKTKADRLPRR